MAISDNPIFTDDQKRLLAHFRASPLSERFYVTGGTALSAFYLHHRWSEDLDFFSEEKVPIEEVLGWVKSLPLARQPEYERKYDRKIFLLRFSESEIMKVEFTTYPFPRFERGPVVDGVQIDSLKDILANKLAALTDRRDPKDYVDLYCALKRYSDLDLRQLARDAGVKFGVKGVEHILRGRFLEPLPPLGVLKMRQELDQEELGRFFSRQAKEWIARSTKEK